MTNLNYKCLLFGAWCLVLGAWCLVLGAWCCALYSLFALVSWWFTANFIPPHDPASTPVEIAGIYHDNTTHIRFGMILLMFAAGFYIPFTAAVANFISRIEGGIGVLSISQILGGMGNVCLTFYPAMWWLIASFRPDENPKLVRLLNDIAWLQIAGGLTSFLSVLVSVAVASFADKSKYPVFPRWTAYFSLWTFALLLPGQLVFFFKSGPFAWNGLLAFWMPLTVFAPWFVVMTIVILKALKLEKQKMSEPGSVASTYEI